MCGISGFLGRNESATIQKLTSTLHHDLSHRGPDGEGIWRSIDTGNPFISLGHNRLAINDLDSRANQPMSGLNGSRIIVNGEIYNAVEIRNTLSGYQFKTNSDSESLLAVLDVYGLEGMKMIDGMYAFAYMPSSADSILLGRDPLGIKPLYWTRNNEGVWFSSEAKPLAKNLGKGIDEHGFAEWAMYQFQVTDRTFYNDIRSVEPGSVMVFTVDDCHTHKFWSLGSLLPNEKTNSYSLDQSVETLKNVFQESVNGHLMADVGITTFVSGGMDSSWVASFAAKKDVRQAYCGRYLEAGFDESIYAKLVAEKANLDLQIIDIDSQKFFSSLDSFGRYMDFPSAGPGAVGQYILASVISKNFRVVLSGTGGDELFLGYTRDRFPLLAMGLIEESKGNSAKWRDIAGNISGLSGYNKMLLKFAQNNGFVSPLDGFLSIVERSDLDSGIFNIDRGLRETIREELIQGISPNGAETLSELHNALLRYEVGKFLPSLLQIEDRVTMAHGLEARVPILSKKMLEFVLPLPLEVRMTGGKPKDLMRMAAKENLPAEVLERTDKMGFPVPLDVWSRGDAKSRVTEEISELRSRSLPFIHNELLDSILNNQDLGNRSLWACISLNTWLKNLED